jgi:hypothetical protein
MRECVRVDGNICANVVCTGMDVGEKKKFKN